MSTDGTSNWQPGDPVHEPPTPDAELTAIETIYGVLAALNSDAQGRVIRWAYDRYVVNAALAGSADDTTSEDNCG